MWKGTVMVASTYYLMHQFLVEYGGLGSLVQ